MNEYDEGVVFEISDLDSSSDESIIEIISDSDSQDDSTECMWFILFLFKYSNVLLLQHLAASDELLFVDLTYQELVEVKDIIVNSLWKSSTTMTLFEFLIIRTSHYESEIVFKKQRNHQNWYNLSTNLCSKLTQSNPKLRQLNRF